MIDFLVEIENCFPLLFHFLGLNFKVNGDVTKWMWRGFSSTPFYSLFPRLSFNFFLLSVSEDSPEIIADPIEASKFIGHPGRNRRA